MVNGATPTPTDLPTWTRDAIAYGVFLLLLAAADAEDLTALGEEAKAIVAFRCADAFLRARQRG